MRLETRKEERTDWDERFVRAGGELHDGRMVALKDDAVWENLGDSGLFDDGMDTDTPPYAFNSGMGWREVGRDEAIALGVLEPNATPEPTEGRFFDVDNVDTDTFSAEDLQLIIGDLKQAERRAA